MLKSLPEIKVSTCTLYFNLQTQVQRAHLQFFKVSSRRSLSTGKIFGLVLSPKILWPNFDDVSAPPTLVWPPTQVAKISFQPSHWPSFLETSPESRWQRPISRRAIFWHSYLENQRIIRWFSENRSNCLPRPTYCWSSSRYYSGAGVLCPWIDQYSIPVADRLVMLS